MSPRLPSPLAADAFARAVDAAGRRPLHAVGADLIDSSDEFDRLLEVVGTLRRAPAPAPRPDFVADLRAQLMATELPAVEAPSPTVVPMVSRRRRRLSAGVAAAAMVLGSAGVAAAAQSAIPGDPLYGAKRGIETIQENLSLNPTAKGSQQLSDATTRLSELATLMHGGSASPTTITSQLADFSNGARSGSALLMSAFQSDGSSGDIAGVRSFTTSAAAALQSLRSTAPAGSLASFTNASALVADIDQRARALCGTCSTAAPVQPVALPTSLTPTSPVKTPAVSTQTAPQTSAPAVKPPTTTVPTVPALPTVPGLSTTSSAPAAGVGSTLTNTVGGLLGTSTPSSAPSGSTGLVSGLTGAVTGTVSGLTGTVTGLLGGLR